MNARRDARLDNMKGVLIFLVVFCHLIIHLVNPRGQLTNAIYGAVYVFHMPAFVFTTGYFARFRPRRILEGLVLPYVVFQTAATAYENVVAGNPPLAGITFTSPQWSLWYLVACVAWYCCVPALELAQDARAQRAVVGVSFAASLLSGFLPWLGDFLDVSRIVALFPFFCAGFYAGRARLSDAVAALERPTRNRLCVLLLAGVVAVLALQVVWGTIPRNALFRDLPFATPADFVGRVYTQCGAVVWCALLFVALPNDDRGIATAAGRNTMCVYLLHTWVIRLLYRLPPLPGSEVAQVLACLAIAVATIATLGNDAVGRRFALVFSGRRR